jgi:hypothetical protein
VRQSLVVQLTLAAVERLSFRDAEPRASGNSGIRAAASAPLDNADARPIASGNAAKD